MPRISFSVHDGRANGDSRPMQSLDWKTLLFGLIGGLGMFLFGMRLMSDGLRSVGSERMRSILAGLTRNTFAAILIGTAVTSLIQSSSATTVLVVGLVNAGLLALKQAVGIVLGANIGTTVTAWMVSAMAFLKPSTYALPAIGIGFLISQVARKQKVKQWGQVLLGFGILFFGLSIMKDGFGPLKESARAASMLGSFGTNPLLGVLVGTAFTMLLQSSSATIAIVQVLAFQGVIPFSAALPLILGDNIGTTITVQIAAFGGTRAARRTAVSHTLFNVIGVIIILPFIYNGWYSVLVQRLVPGLLTPASAMVHIAAAHTLFNVVNVMLWVPAIGFLTRLATRFVPGEDVALPPSGPKHLARHLLETPGAAIQATVEELAHMAEVARDTARLSFASFFAGDDSRIREIRCSESGLDELQIAITDYLIEISERHPHERDTRMFPVLIHSVNDLEKVGDYCFNLTQLIERMKSENLTIPEEALPNLHAIAERVDRMMSHLIQGLKSRSVAEAEPILALESEIDSLRDNSRRRQIDRLLAHKDDPRAEILCMDFATNLEKMADHVTNIAQALKEDLSWVSRLVQAADEDDGSVCGGRPSPPSRRAGPRPRAPRRDDPLVRR